MNTTSRAAQEETVRTQTPTGPQWQFGPETNPVSERDWRHSLLVEASYRAARVHYVRLVEILASSAPALAEAIVEEVSALLADALDAAHQSAESLRDMHATPETDEPAAVEAKLAEVINRAPGVPRWHGLDADSKRAILDLPYARELEQRWSSIFNQIETEQGGTR